MKKAWHILIVFMGKIASSFGVQHHLGRLKNKGKIIFFTAPCLHIVLFL